jgi:hypothetical protein
MLREPGNITAPGVSSRTTRDLYHLQDSCSEGFHHICHHDQANKPDHHIWLDHRSLVRRVSRHEELRGRYQQAEQATWSLPNFNDPEVPFAQAELKRISGEMKLLGDSTRGLELVPNSTRAVEISEGTKALQQLDLAWEVLYLEA